MKIITSALLCLLSMHAYAETAESNVQASTAEVMIFGTFHFSNPGLDVVKNKQADVGTPEN